MSAGHVEPDRGALQPSRRGLGAVAGRTRTRRRTRRLWWTAAALLALSCSRTPRVQVEIQAEGFGAGEVTRVEAFLLDDAGALLRQTGFDPVAGAAPPFLGAFDAPDLAGVGAIALELRGPREIHARGRWEVPETAGDLEMKVAMARGRYEAGCADLDGDGYGQGPDCLDDDCDDTDPGAHPDAVEVCNGFDDDCDGLADPGCTCTPGERSPCRTFPLGAVGVGPCAVGEMVCDEEGTFGECEGEVAPVPEAAGRIGVDDDCDGLFDEDEPCLEGEVVFCFDGPPQDVGRGQCRSGVQTCIEGAFGHCEGATYPEDELCASELDEDCDGEIDEAECWDGPLVFGADAVQSAAAIAETTCQGEDARTATADGIDYRLSGLSVSGLYYGTVGVELGVHPDLGGAELTYATESGAGELGESLELAVEALEACGGSDFFEMDGPWTDEEQIVSIDLKLTCLEPAACAGAPVVLRAIELY